MGFSEGATPLSRRCQSPVSRDAEALRSGARNVPGRGLVIASWTWHAPRSAPQSLRVAANHERPRSLLLLLPRQHRGRQLLQVVGIDRLHVFQLFRMLRIARQVLLLVRVSLQIV